MTSARTMLLTLCWLALAPAVSQSATLYDDLGGETGIRTIVDLSLQRWLVDPRIASTFADSNMDRLRHFLAEQFCQLTDGPCSYTGRSMAAAHRGLDLNRAQFNALTEDLQDAMSEVGIGFHTQNRLIAKLAPMQRDVVTQ